MSGNSVPYVHQKVGEAMSHSQPLNEEDPDKGRYNFKNIDNYVGNNNFDNSQQPRDYDNITSHYKINGKDNYSLPELPDFTKRPKIMSNESSYTHKQSSMEEFNNISDEMFHKDTYEPFYKINDSGFHSRNASVTFFSDQFNDEHTYNELPLNEILDDFDYDEDANIDDEGMIIYEGAHDHNSNNHNQVNADNIISSTDHLNDLHYDSIGRDIKRGESPFMRQKKIEYVSEIPFYYDSTKLVYPNKSPLDYTDEEFMNINHFDLLKDLHFSSPPLLPVYLNSNLLNDSSSKNYKTYPYQYQESTTPHVNEIYRYRINDLNIMDKYSANKSTLRPILKRSSSSNSSSSSSMLNKSKNNIVVRNKLLRMNSAEGSNKLKHQDKINLIERSLIPHHVMLNHLITCNLNKNGYITSSCITRYKGKFITQIMYFSNELEKL